MTRRTEHAPLLLALALTACDRVGGRCEEGVGAAISTRGALVVTAGWTDVALAGDAFLVVEDAAGRERYTRAGQLTVDGAGRLVTPDGSRVKLFPEGRPGAAPAVSGPPVQSAGWATTYVRMSGYLPAGAEVMPFDLARVWQSGEIGWLAEVVDALGVRHGISFLFVREAPDRWGWYGVVDGAELQGGSPGAYALAAQGTLQFSQEGWVAASTYVAAPWFAGARAPQPLRIDLSGIAQLGRPGRFMVADSDGEGAEPLVVLDVREGGVVMGYYGHDHWEVAGRLALATFDRPETLVAVRPHLYVAPAACEGGVHVAPASRGDVLIGTVEELTGQP